MQEPLSRDALELIECLITFDTTSSRSNLELINFVAQWLQAHDIAVTLIHDADGNKANLIAEFGPKDAPAILVSGHSDVVPADPADWSVTQPFVPRRHQGRLYGRGSADMKGFIGIALNSLVKARHRLQRNAVVLALSFDEELGCLGAPLMLPHLRLQAHRLRGAIIGEPTSMRIGNAHKGHVAMRATVHGIGGHSGYPERGVNAIDVAAGLVLEIRRLAEEKRLNTPPDHRFDPPWSTVHTGLIQGGSALNKIPERCQLDFEMRTLPGQDSEEVLSRLSAAYPQAMPTPIQALAEQARLELECVGQYPQLDEQRQGYINWLAALAQCDSNPVALGFGCEAGLLASLGIPALICGPGSIHQAHLPDEYIEFDQLERCEAFFSRLIDALDDELPTFE